MEKIKSKGYQVLFMTEPMDEYCMNQLKQYDDTPIVCVTKEGLVFEETEEEKLHYNNRVKELETLSKEIKEVLGEGFIEYKAE